MRPNNLLLAIFLPADFAPAVEDPDEMADLIVAVLNDRMTSAKRAEAKAQKNWERRAIVNAIPAPQWLTREVLDRLTAAASEK